MLPTRPLVVVPTYDEVLNIDALLDGIARHAPNAHVLFVDDHSRDGTAERIRKHQSSLPGRIHLLERPAKLGLGTAYVAGFRWALARDYDAVLQMDADLSHDPADLPRLLDLPQDRDAVIGSRYVPGGATANWTLPRKLLSRMANGYARRVLDLPLRDLTAGFTAWRRRVLETVALDRIGSEGYAFQVELKYRAVQAGFALAEVPIAFVERRAGQSKLSASVAFEAVFRVWGLRSKR